MDERLERALIAVARRYAPSLAPPGWQRPGDYDGRLPELAGVLAEHSVLVTLVQSPPGQSVLVTPVWVDGLQTLYACLAGALFPSYTGINAFYADQNEPPIVLLQGEATPVIMALAGYIIPYLAARHGANPPESEQLDLLDAALDWLEAADLSRTDFLRLRGEAVSLLRPLLDSPARPTALAPAARGAPIPARTRPAPASLPEAKPAGATPPPTTLPEAASSLPEAPRPPLPVVFQPPARPARRRPPVPNLPE
ncbi:MAG TPA: hypothetical protein VER79_13250 [Candidatus Limnocylindrales bacterium]|nr:hypothetical protein [Candidatus Limnocylindrales bacterium]